MLEKFRNSKLAKRIGVMVASVATLAVSVFAASAAEEANISSTLVTSFSGVTDQMKEVITGILPYAIGLLGLTMAVTMGIKYFKKFAGKAG